MCAWGDLKKSCHRYLAGGLTMFLVKKYFEEQNMALKAQFQMLLLACFSQASN